MSGKPSTSASNKVVISCAMLAESNAQQVEKIARILDELSLEIATPDEARQKLGLKGRDRTAIPA
jgi:uncharacterized protein (DUF849 family)